MLKYCDTTNSLIVEASGLNYTVMNLKKTERGVKIDPDFPIPKDEINKDWGFLIFVYDRPDITRKINEKLSFLNDFLSTERSLEEVFAACEIN